MVLKKDYRGDCRTILERDDLFDDATQMAQVVENSKRINKAQYNKLVGGKVRAKYKYGQYKDLVWRYDPKRDIHHFYL